MDFSGLVLAEAVLSYLNIGVDPATYSWGNMINSARALKWPVNRLCGGHCLQPFSSCSSLY